MKYVVRIGYALLAVVLLGLIAWKGVDFLAEGHARVLPVQAPTDSEPTTITQPSVPTDLPADVTIHADGSDFATVLDVPYLDQNAFPTGCECVSAVMLLQYWGVDITVDEFIDGYLPCTELRQRNGDVYGPHPNQRFIGDPRSYTGFGCYAPVIGRAIQNLLADEGTDLTVGNRCDRELADLAKKYIDRQIPVLIWATINMVEPYDGAQWINPMDDSTVTWIANEHCLVLVGYDDEAYYCNDPYNANGVIRVPRSLLEERYEQLGKQALIIRQAN